MRKTGKARQAAAGAEARAVSERRVTVSSLMRSRGRCVGAGEQHVPLLRLAGHWLARTGFAIGGKVRVRVEGRRLVLTPLPASEGASCR